MDFEKFQFCTSHLASYNTVRSVRPEKGRERLRTKYENVSRLVLEIETFLVSLPRNNVGVSVSNEKMSLTTLLRPRVCQSSPLTSVEILQYWQ